MAFLACAKHSPNGIERDGFKPIRRTNRPASRHAQQKVSSSDRLVEFRLVSVDGPYKAARCYFLYPFVPFFDSPLLFVSH